MRKIFLVAIEILLLAVWQTALAQINPVFENISKNQGLSDNTVNAFAQDLDGFLWIATDNGLNKYNGFDFEIYSHEPNNPKSLSDNRVTSVYVDKYNQVWAGTYSGGVNLFNRETKSFTRFGSSELTPRITNLYLADKNNLWMASSIGLIKLTIDKKEFISFSPENEHNLPTIPIFSIVVDAKNKMWVNSAYGVYKFDPISNKFTRYLKLEAPPKTIVLNDFDCKMALHSNGRLFIPTLFRGLYELNTLTGEVISHYKRDENNPDGLKTDALSALLLFDENTLWIGTQLSGIERLDLTTKKVIHYENNPKNPNSLSGNSIHALYKDRSNVVWVSNGTYGISKYAPYKNKFELYQYNRFSENSLSNNYIRGIFQDQNDIVWIGTQYGGLNRLDRKTGQFQLYRSKLDDPNSLALDAVWAVYEDRQKELWIGSYGATEFIEEYGLRFAYLQRLDRKTGKFTIFNKEIYGVTAICESQDGSLWLGASKYNRVVYHISPDRKTITPFFESIFNEFGAGEIQAITEDNFGDIWVGTSDGLFRYNQKNNKYNFYKHNQQDLTSIAQNNITCFLLDSKNNFWLTTKGGGICKFNPQTNNFTRIITKKATELNPNVYAMLEDKKGRFWLSTDNGIVKYDPANESFIRFDLDDGLQDREFNRLSFHQNKQGEIFFGGINGLNVFHPDNIETNPVAPLISISSVKLLDTHQELKKDIVQQEIYLSYDQNNLLFQYIALDFNSPLDNIYAYKLEGLDGDWTLADKKREVIYSNLAPNEYIFRVKAANNDGVWNETGAAIKITVYPPLWKRWWAYLIYVLTGLALIQYRFYSLKKINLSLEEKVNNRTRELAQSIEQLRVSEQSAIEAKNQAVEASYAKSAFLAMMSHEIRTPMNGIIGMTSLLANTKTTPEQQDFIETIRVSGESLLTIINDILDFSKIESGKLELDKVTFNLLEIIEQVIALLKPQAVEKSLKLNLITSDNTITYVKGDSTRLKQVLTNLIGNSIKFTSQGEVTLLVSSKQVDENSHEIYFQVKDTGIGISAEHQAKLFQPFIQGDSSTTRKYGGTGLGLNISKKICELMGGRIWLKSELGKGSEFHFTILVKLADVSEQQKKTKFNEIPKLANTLPLKILLADDNLINQKVALKLLDALGYQADTAFTGLEVLNKLKHQQYDVILMDVQMPEMDGLRATKEIHKTYPSQSRPRIIAMTAGAMDGDREQCLAAGMDDYISKPIDFEQLINSLSKIKSIEQETISNTLHSINKNSVKAEIDYSMIEKLKMLETEDNQDFLESLVEIFLTDVAENIALLLEAIKQQNQKNLQFTAHKLKGYCSNLGAKKMQKIIQELENSNSFLESEKLVLELNTEFLLVTIELKNLVKKTHINNS